MTSKIMPGNKAIAQHLTCAKSNHGFSSYAALVRDARSATGRCSDTGEKLNPSRHGNWLGAIGYLGLMDHIGKCFEPEQPSRTTTKTQNIIKTFTYYSNLSNDEISAIYALRCGFAHEYCLFNISERKKTATDKTDVLTHFFKVGVGPTSRIVSLPTKPWNGDFDGKLKHQTEVNLEALGDLCEQIISNIDSLSQSNSLKVILKGGSDELVSGYLYWRGP